MEKYKTALHAFFFSFKINSNGVENRRFSVNPLCWVTLIDIYQESWECPYSNFSTLLLLSPNRNRSSPPTLRSEGPRSILDAWGFPMEKCYGVEHSFISTFMSFKFANSLWNREFYSSRLILRLNSEFKSALIWCHTSL